MRKGSVFQAFFPLRMTLLSLLSAAIFLYANVTWAVQPDICESNSEGCLAALERSLVQTKEGSLPWYDLKMRHLEVLFNLTHYDRLQREIAFLIDKPSLPLLLKTRVTIYHAKMLNMEGHRKEAEAVLAHGVELLLQTNQAFPRPQYLIEIANLQLGLKLNREAYDTLLAIEKRFQDRDEPEFQHELYANLGHAAHSFGDLGRAAYYREQAVKWSIRQGDPQQLSIAMGNLAYTHQLMEQYSQAADWYRKALEAAKVAGDLNALAIYYVRLAENLVALGRDREAKVALDQVDTARLSVKHLTLMMKMRGEMRGAANVQMPSDMDN